MSILRKIEIYLQMTEIGKNSNFAKKLELIFKIELFLSITDELK